MIPTIASMDWLDQHYDALIAGDIIDDPRHNEKVVKTTADLEYLERKMEHERNA